MKFICKDHYRQFNGYVFAYGKPTDVIDKATIQALQSNSDFTLAEDESVKMEVKRPVLKKSKKREPVEYI